MNGPPPREALDGSGTRWQPLAFRLDKVANDKKGLKRVLTASNEQLSFSASSSDATKGVYKYVVGFISHKRKRVEVYDAACSGVVLRLRPVRAAAGEDEAAAVEDMAGASAKARRDMLIDSFGSRKKQKMERSKAANIVDVRAVTAAGSVAADLQERAGVAEREGSGAAGGTTAARVAAGLAASRAAILPPHDERATTLEGAYPVDAILGGNAVVDALGPVVNEFMKVLKDAGALADAIGARIGQRVPGAAYLRDRLTAVTAVPDEGAGGLKKAVVRRNLRCVLLLQHMIALSLSPADKLRFVEAKPKEGGVPTGEMYVPCLRGAPPPLVSHLLSLFRQARVELKEPPRGGAPPTAGGEGEEGTETVYARTEGLASRLSAYIAVLALVLDEGRIADLRPLAAALKSTPVTLLRSFREVGCGYEPIRAGEAAKAEGEGKGEAENRSGVVSYSVHLKLPLVFPKPKAGPRRG